MLTAHHLNKSYNVKTILHDISLTINPRDRLGLIGPNGSGKTTLLRILAGLEEADSGVITLNQPDIRIGYLAQGLQFDPDMKVGEFLQDSAGDLSILEQNLTNLASQMILEPERPDLQLDYNLAIEQINWTQQNRNRSYGVLGSLGVDAFDADKAIGSLSGGQKTRLALARILLISPQVLLLDEPTNHLDISMLEWLETWLVNYPGGALIVSHDRAFLDNTVNTILDLDPITHTTHQYKGNYSDYLDQYLAEQERLDALYRDQVYQIQKMRRDIQRTKQQSMHVELTTTSRQPGVRRIAKKVARKAKSREKKLERYQESDDRVEKPKLSWQMKLEFSPMTHLSQEILRTEQMAIGYPDLAPFLQDINLVIRGGERIALTGPNGGGKTTFMRTIAGELPPLHGSVHIGSSIKTGYMPQEQEFTNLTHSALEIIQTSAALNDTDARTFLHKFLISGDDSLRPVRELSYGERARLLLATLVVKGCNFLLLDEPINHLDIPSRLQFELALHQFEGTVLMVVHDRYFIQRYASQVWVLEDRSLRQIVHL
jgi:ATP-binding cassette subfamily F protein 3